MKWTRCVEILVYTLLVSNVVGKVSLYASNK